MGFCFVSQASFLEFTWYKGVVSKFEIYVLTVMSGSDGISVLLLESKFVMLNESSQRDETIKYFLSGFILR